jgi:DNA-binding NtrC family response regulator
VQQGNFRQDLYYRLNVLGMRIPSLRERPEDYELLTRHLVRKLALKLEKGAVRIDEGFFRKIESHGWPGNIRELENALERALIRSGAGGVLCAEMLDFCCCAPQLARKAEAAPPEISSLRDGEKRLICEALAAYDYNIQKVAAKLGIGRNTLYRKMKEYGL